MNRMQEYIRRKQEAITEACDRCSKAHEDYLKLRRQLKNAERIQFCSCRFDRPQAHKEISGEHYIYAYDKRIMDDTVVSRLLNYVHSKAYGRQNHEPQTFASVQELLRAIYSRGLTEQEYSSLVKGVHNLSPFLDTQEVSRKSLIDKFKEIFWRK
jgi:hypothetical protein